MKYSAPLKRSRSFAFILAVALWFNSENRAQSAQNEPKTSDVAPAGRLATVALEIPDAMQPHLFAAADGRVWLVYGQSKDVFVAHSKDRGTTFGRPVKVATVPALMLGMRRGPRIAAHGDRVTVTLIADELLAYTSTDGGLSWKAPARINGVSGSAREGLHGLAGGPNGELFVTWLDLRSGKTELWGAFSSDGGQIWSPELFYKSPDKSICECCHPSALFNSNGGLAVMWRNSIEGARDMWIATRYTYMRTFAPARKLGEGTWKINACPMDGGQIVDLSTGGFGAVWQRAGELFFSGHGDSEVGLGPGKQPVAVARGGQVVGAWQRGTDLVISRDLTRTETAKHASDARFPSLIASPDGKSVILAYERGPSKGPMTVVVERLE